MPKPSKSAKPRHAVGYLRVSTDEQHLGPEAQRAAIERWCAANGLELVAVREDHGVSGGAELDARPGLLGALDDLRAHRAGVLVVAKRDRLARDVVIAAMVERLVSRSGARIDSADGSGNGAGPEAEMMRGIMAVFAQYERALIRARTRAALGVKRARGERVGEVPYGYRLGADGRTLEADPSEQAVIAAVRRLRAEGLSLRAIAERLNADAAPARGQRWHLTSVARLVRREAA